MNIKESNERGDRDFLLISRTVFIFIRDSLDRVLTTRYSQQESPFTQQESCGEDHLCNVNPF